MSQSASRSSTTSSTTYNTRTDNFNLQGTSGGTIVAGNEGATINLLDDGAIAHAFDFANKAEGDAFDFGRNALDFAGTVNQRAINSLEMGFDKNAQVLTNLANKVTLDSGERVQAVTQYALLAVAAVVALMFFGGRAHAN